MNTTLKDRVEKAVPSPDSREILRLRGEVRRLRSENAGLHDELDRAERRSEVVATLQEQRAFETWERDRVRRPQSHSAILVLSDWHFEESVSLEGTYGKNQYTLEIAHARAKHTFQKAVEYWDRYTHGATEFVVAVLGDMITGFIHDELKETNSLSPPQAMHEVFDVLRSGLEFIAKETRAKHIPVPCCFGNHSRTTKKRQVKNEWRHSYEYAVYEWLEKTFAKHRSVRVIPSKSYINYQTIQGRLVRFHHGHAVKYAGGVGGITIPMYKRIHRWDQSCKSDLDVFGHFHSLQSGEGFRWICNGSMIGQGEYSADLGFDPTPPNQAFLVFDAKYGVRHLAHIFCDPTAAGSGGIRPRSGRPRGAGNRELGHSG